MNKKDLFLIIICSVIFIGLVMGVVIHSLKYKQIMDNKECFDNIAINYCNGINEKFYNSFLSDNSFLNDNSFLSVNGASFECIELINGREYLNNKKLFYFTNEEFNNCVNGERNDNRR
jgi:hypothetical protein